MAEAEQVRGRAGKWLCGGRIYVGNINWGFLKCDEKPLKGFKQGSDMFNWALSNHYGLNGLKVANIGTRKTK